MTEPPSMRGVVRLWLPLAGSWLMMALELPALSAVVARLPDAQTNLAAYGSVAFPLALIIEAPIIMLLSASTALSKDQAAYRSLRRFADRTSLVLTLLHAALAFTPLFDVLVVPVMDVPDAVVEPARLCLKILLPWTWAIASRRFHQGVIIRAGRGRAVTIGTGIRIATHFLILGAGYLAQLPGVVVAATAVSCAVTLEAGYAAAVAVPIRDKLPPGSADDPPLRGWGFAQFYVPLALTSLIALGAQPLCTAAMSRMPRALDSLAVWPVVSGLLFILQSTGLALQEVVVAKAGEDAWRPHLARFSAVLAGITGSLVLILSFTPLAGFWFRTASGLDVSLAALGAGALWLGVLVPVGRAIQSLFQGILVDARKTRAVTESVALFFVVCGGVLFAGVYSQWGIGLRTALIAFSVGRLIQTLWVAFRAKRLGVLARR